MADRVQNLPPSFIGSFDLCYLRENSNQGKGDQQYRLLRYGNFPDVKVFQSTIPLQGTRHIVRSHPDGCWRGKEASHLNVYTKVKEVRAVVGENHESSGCNAGGDSAARWIAQYKMFKLRHCSR